MGTDQLSPARVRDDVEVLLEKIRNGSVAVKVSRKKTDLVRARLFRDRAIVKAASLYVARWEIVNASGLSGTRVQQIINEHP